jgi:hypothetical protein
MKDLPWHPNLPWVFALRAHADISSVERHGTHYAHQTYPRRVGGFLHSPLRGATTVVRGGL